MTGQLSRLRHAGPGLLPLHQWYLGLYVADAWRANSRVTLNAGLRWEPFFGQQIENGSISNFSLDNFRTGVKTTRFVNAPPGLLYPGDPGFPDGKSGMKKQWANLSPRVGLAWDVTGDGRTAVRSSYGLAYDFVSAQYLYIAGSAPPFSNRIELNGLMPFEDPYSTVPGGQTHPVPNDPPANAPYPGFGAFGAMDPDNNSPRVQNWNVTFERQIGSVWQASASYLGSYADRLWGAVQVNPGLFLGLNPCTLNGVSYPVCTTAANVDRRRVLILENPALGQFFGPIDIHDDVGQQSYAGLKLAVQRRSATGVSLSANYTVSRCEGDTGSGFGFAQFSSGYLKPDDPSFDRGNCTQNRTHIANVSVGAETPAFANATLRALASGWRVIGHFQRAVRELAHRDDQHGCRGHRHRRPACGPGARESVRRQDAEHLSESRRVRDARARHPGQPSQQQRCRPGVLECRSGALETPVHRRPADARASSGDVQSVQHLQLGQSGDELQCGHVRPDSVPDGRSAHHAVRCQIWLLREGIR